MSRKIPDTLSEDLFRVLFEKSPGSLLVKADAPRFTISAASDAYLKVTSVTREQVLGKGFFEVFTEENDLPDDDTTARKVFTKVIRTCQKLDVSIYRYDVFEPETNDRQPHYWSCSNTPILDQENCVAYILNTVIDITAEVKAKEAAIESENRLLLAAEATGLAVWDLDISSGNYNLSPQLPAIFGYPAQTEVTLVGIRSQIHTEDRQNIIVKAYQDALVTGIYFYEARIFWPDGSLHWIRVKGMLHFNKNKEPIRMLGTLVDITESKRDEIRKNDFIAMASHELKTPLTSLKAYLQLLENKLNGTTDPFIKTAVVKSGNQVNKMTALIHSFLDVSKLEPGKLQLNRQIFDINQLIKETVSDNRLLSSTHLIFYESSGQININADRQKIGQVIGNLISNAIKYSPRGSDITIRSKAKQDQVQISVTDQGIGIRPKDQQKIFQRFYRAEEEKFKNISGFDIGLYLSSEIVQRHQGKIWVISKKAEGSTFYFSLPLTA